MSAEASGRAVIRVDSGTRLGSGHLARCLTLAEELRRRGVAVQFICRELPGHLCAHIERAGFALSRLPAGEPPWQEDAQQTAALLERLRPHWLIVDHYGLGAPWETAQRALAERIMVIDDLADRRHDCDLLLDQNFFGAATLERYQGLLPPAAQPLLGPHFALLRPEYAAARATLAPRGTPARRVLVYFGASDVSDQSATALKALSTPQFAHLAVELVLGPNYPAAGAAAQLAAARPNTTVHRDLVSLAPLMAAADLAVGAGGATTWERLCLELPSVVVSIAANQDGPTAALAAAGLLHFAGRAPFVSVAQLASCIADALAAVPAPQPLVDGYGVRRVAAVLLPPAAQPLRLQPARSSDAALLFHWRNEPLARAMSFDERPIGWQAHLAWLAAKLADRDAAIFIAMAGELPVGQVRLESQAGEAELSYSVDPLFRRRGFGTALVEAATASVPGRVVRARVKAANTVSRRIFEQLGWRAQQVGADYVFRLPDGQRAPGPPGSAR